MIDNIIEFLPYFTGTATLFYGLWLQNIVYLLIFLTNITVFIFTGFLKRLIKQERPNKRSLHGMPSGHCSYFFSLTTMLYYLHDGYIFFYSFIISGLIAYQRLTSRNHTKNQVIVGTIFGYTISFLMYKFIILYLINVKL